LAFPAFVIALAWPARAHDIDHVERTYGGGSTQTWEDIERARQEGVPPE
jgi:hypothetical protein